MSELRIALVAEGPTDQVVIEAALKAILPNSFVLTLLQPEATRPEMGGGWPGVFKWCREFRSRGYSFLENDPSLFLFDMIIVHLDADVADKSYSDCGAAVTLAAEGLPTLPCSAPCPPPSDTADRLRALLLGWLGSDAVGLRTVFCIPSKASEAWLAAAVFHDREDILTGIECEMNMEGILAHLPKGKRIRKSRREYLLHAPSVTADWETVTQRCSQARLFDGQVHSLVASLAV